MKSAQETFGRMMKDEIAPTLRQLGFKGSGQRFELPSGDTWAVLGFQKSQRSDSDEVRFTINIAVVARDAWTAERESFFPERPGANTRYGIGWETRIGDLIPGNLDRWWTVQGGRATARIAGEVVSAIEQYALPAMVARMSRQSD